MLAIMARAAGSRHRLLPILGLVRFESASRSSGTQEITRVMNRHSSCAPDERDDGPRASATPPGARVPARSRKVDPPVRPGRAVQGEPAAGSGATWDLS